MIVYETDFKKYNFLELLLDLHFSGAAPRKKILPVILAQNFLERIQGRYVILYYLGETSLTPQHGKTALQQLEAVKWAFSYISKCIGNVKDFILWWYDDGRIEQLLNKCEDRTEAQRLIDEIIKFCLDCEHIIYDNSKDKAKAVLCADLLYGDVSPLEDDFIAQRKPVKMQDLYSQHPENINFSLNEWIGGILCPSLELADITGWQGQQIENGKVYICYLSANALMTYGVTAVARLRIVLDVLLNKHQAYCIWLRDKNLPSVLAMLKDTCRNDFLILQEQVMSSGRCLCDDQHSLQEFSSFASGYYGDISANADMMAKLKKPVVLMNPDGYFPNRVSERYQGMGVGLQFMGGCWCGDFYYFCSLQTNGLYRYMRGSDEARLVANVPVRNMRGIRAALFSNIIPWQNKLYCIPLLAEKLMIYDLSNGKWTIMSLSDEYVASNKAMFMDACIIGECIWMIPHSYNAVVCLDLRSQEMRYISDWSAETLPHVTKPDRQHYFGKAVLKNCLYFNAIQSPHIIEIDCIEMKGRVHEISCVTGGLMGIASDGEDLWLSNHDGELIRWNCVDGVKHRWDHLLGERSIDTSIAYHSGSIWIFAWWQDMYARYDLATKKIQIIKHYLPDDLRNGLGAASLGTDKEAIYLYPNNGELLVRFEPQSGQIEAKSIRLHAQDFWEYYPVEQGKPIMYESDFIDINELLYYLESGHIDKMVGKISGEKIYNAVRHL